MIKLVRKIVLHRHPCEPEGPEKHNGHQKKAIHLTFPVPLLLKKGPYFCITMISKIPCAVYHKVPKLWPVIYSDDLRQDDNKHALCTFSQCFQQKLLYTLSRCGRRPVTCCQHIWLFYLHIKCPVLSKTFWQ